MVAKKTLSTFIQEAELKYGIGKYDYSLITEYVNNKIKMPIRCNIHDIVFEVASNDFLGKKSVSCPECKKKNSKTLSDVLYKRFKEFLDSLDVEYKVDYVHPDSKVKYSFYFEDKKLGIVFVNSNTGFTGTTILGGVNLNTYKNNTLTSLKFGITCLTVFDFYLNQDIKFEIYKSKIKHYLGMDTKIYARKLKIVPIDNALAYDFYSDNHLEHVGFTYKDSNSYALMDVSSDTIYMCATIGDMYVQSSKTFKKKLHRICTRKGYTVVGGISKLSKFLEKEHGKFTYEILMSSGASSLNTCSKYTVKTSRYFWVNTKDLSCLHRNRTQKHLLEQNFKQPLLDDDTETTYMERLGYVKVYDSGVAEIEW